MDRRSFIKGLIALASAPAIGKYVNVFKTEGARKGIENVASQGVDFFNSVIKKVMDEGTLVKEQDRTSVYKHPDRPDIMVEIDQGTGSSSVYFDTDQGSKAGAEIIKTMDETTKGRTVEELMESEEVYKMGGDEYYKDVQEEITGGITNLEEFLRRKKGFAAGGRVGMFRGGVPKGLSAALRAIMEKYGKDSIKVLENEPDFGMNILNDYNIARPESAVIRDKMKNFGKPGKFNEDGSIDYDYYAEILNDSENTFVYGDESIESLEAMAKERLDEIAEYKAMYDRGELDKYAPSKLDNVNDDQIAAAVDDIFPTGDIKYDAEMAAEALVENNPQIFGDMLYEDLPDKLRSDIYGAVLEVLSGNSAKMRELKKLSKPTNTLASMKAGKGIDMSDPNIADEFTRFMKETDPKGYEDLEQKVELSNFKTKGRKKNADGGIINLTAMKIPDNSKSGVESLFKRR